MVVGENLLRPISLYAALTAAIALNDGCLKGNTLQSGMFPYVYVDGVYLCRSWSGEYENVAILVAIAVNEDGYRELLGAAEGMKGDKTSRASFFRWLRGMRQKVDAKKVEESVLIFRFCVVWLVIP